MPFNYIVPVLVQNCDYLVKLNWNGRGSNSEVWSRLIAGIACSNPVEGMDVCLLCMLYVVYVAASATG